MRNADLAMCRAKDQGEMSCVVYEPEMQGELTARLELQDDLTRALVRGELEPHFQPKVHFQTGQVVGMEALVRWHRPGRGIVSPAEFLPLAAANGQMQALTERMLERSLEAAKDWWAAGNRLEVAVNLSAEVCGEDLPQLVEAALLRSGLPGEALRFEITEDALMRDPERAAASFAALSEHGVNVSIDDFGTGYSSLSRLKSMPIDELKIDRRFVRTLTEDRDDETIVQSTIDLAHSMGLRVVAEGIETSAAWWRLRAMGCEHAQGFLIGRPMPARDVLGWLSDWKDRSPARLSPTPPAPAESPAPA
jgi:EAL domain-containing protein (putative c-di-GMP-specific phosphodiesterase class I)